MEVAPIQSGILLVHFAKPLEDPSQPADVLRRDVADLLAPCVIGIGKRRRAGVLQGLAPLADDASLFPVGGANQMIPTADVFAGGLNFERRLFFHVGRFLGGRNGRRLGVLTFLGCRKAGTRPQPTNLT